MTTTALLPASPATLAALLAQPKPAAPAAAAPVRVAWTTATGDLPLAPARKRRVGVVINSEPYCFVCSRCTDHFAEHDDLVEIGAAAYGKDGSVYDLR